MIRAITYNIEHCANENRNKAVDMRAYGKFISELGADVIGLNEVYADTEGWFQSVPEEDKTEGYGMTVNRLARLAAYQFTFFAPATVIGGHLYGNALLSRYKIVEAQNIGIPDPEVRDEDTYYETRCILHAVIDFPEGRAALYISHFGLAVSERRNAVKILYDLLLSERLPYICMGDFNMKPDSMLLAPLRFVTSDTASIKKTSPLYTFPSVEPDRKIDYILTSKNIVTESAEVPGVVLSDHLPYIANLLLR